MENGEEKGGRKWKWLKSESETAIGKQMSLITYNI